MHVGDGDTLKVDTVEITTTEQVPTKDGLPMIPQKDGKKGQQAFDRPSNAASGVIQRKIDYADPYRGLFLLRSRR